MEQRAEEQDEFRLILDHVVYIASHDLDEDQQTVHQFDLCELRNGWQIEQFERDASAH